MREGVSTVIAILLLVILITSFFGMFYTLSVRLDEYQDRVIQVNNEILEKAKEDVEIVNIYLSDNGTLIFQVYNDGGYTARLVSLWVNDTHIDLTDDYLYIGPGQFLSFDSGVTVEGNKTYTFKLVTERGNIIIDYWPKLTHIGTGAAEVPGGVGGAELVGSWAAGKLTSVDVAEIRNIGTVPFKLNVLCRIVFLRVSDGKAYSGYIKQINDTSISPTAPADWESDWIYPGETAVLSFTMYETPESGYYYDVYLHLFGYDGYGNLYSQSIYLGRYYLEQP